MVSDFNRENNCAISDTFQFLGSKLGYSTSPKDEDTPSMHDVPSSSLDLKEMERSFELEI
jgi:hypothetical protein